MWANMLVEFENVGHYIDPWYDMEGKTVVAYTKLMLIGRILIHELTEKIYF